MNSREDILGRVRARIGRTTDRTTTATGVDAVENWLQADGENNYAYATIFAAVNRSLSSAQRTKLATLRHSILSGQYADGTPFDYTVATTPYLYSEPIKDITVLSPYVGNTDWLFFEPAN
jgi:hypothetical protein